MTKLRGQEAVEQQAKQYDKQQLTQIEIKFQQEEHQILQQHQQQLHNFNRSCYKGNNAML